MRSVRDPVATSAPLGEIAHARTCETSVIKSRRRCAHIIRVPLEHAVALELGRRHGADPPPEKAKTKNRRDCRAPLDASRSVGACVAANWQLRSRVAADRDGTD